MVTIAWSVATRELTSGKESAYAEPFTFELAQLDASGTAAGSASATASADFRSNLVDASGTSPGSGSAFGDLTSAWGEKTTFTGVMTDSYLDTTVAYESWYRYRVAVADGGSPVSDFTLWVQAQAPEAPEAGFQNASGSAPATATVTAAPTLLIDGVQALDTSAIGAGGAIAEASPTILLSPLRVSFPAVANIPTNTVRWW